MSLLPLFQRPSRTGPPPSRNTARARAIISSWGHTISQVVISGRPYQPSRARQSQAQAQAQARVPQQRPATVRNISCLSHRMSRVLPKGGRDSHLTCPFFPFRAPPPHCSARLTPASLRAASPLAFKVLSASSFLVPGSHRNEAKAKSNFEPFVVYVIQRRALPAATPALDSTDRGACGLALCLRFLPLTEALDECATWR
jgi:hypothetical protein